MDDGFPDPLFTFGMAEIDPKHAGQAPLFERLAAKAQAGRRQVVTFRSTDLAESRRTLAAIYALGGLMIAPWDVYLRSTPGGSDRHFGRPEDYADLYGFVRTQAAWLDDFELTAAVGDGIALRPDLLRAEAPGSLVVLRQGPKARLALHAISWDRPGSARVSVKTNRRSARLATPEGVRPLAARWRAGWLSLDLPPTGAWALVQVG